MKIKLLLCLGAAIYILPFLAWLAFLGDYGSNKISTNGSSWGEFGSFIGGVLPPAFGFLSVIFLYKTIEITSKNHSSQMKTMETQIEHLQAQDRRSQLMEFCRIYNEKLGESVAKHMSPLLKIGYNINIYDGMHEDVFTLEPVPVSEAMVSFHEKNKPGLVLSKQYIDILSGISTNAEHCYCAILDLLLSVDNKEELEALTNLAEAIPDYYTTKLLLDFYLARVRYYKKSPTLERLCKLNEKTEFNPEHTYSYKKSNPITQTKTS